MQELLAVQHYPRSGPTPAHHAFGALKPVSPDYPTLPIDEGFSWSAALEPINHGAWYLVVFRSMRKTTADTALLTEYDDQAHREALEGDGLLFYFQGQLNDRRECLSFCVWENQERALAGARGALHQAAVSITAAMYDHYRLERYHIVKDGATGVVRFAPAAHMAPGCPAAAT